MNAWEELRPATSYTVYGKQLLDYSQEQALLYLYQPIIGADALSLFLTLMGDILPTGESEPLLHAELLTALNLGLPKMYQARIQLEGIGLLDSYERQTDEQQIVKYFLQEPLSPTAFFQEALLSNLLLARIGDRKFQRLVKKFQPAHPNLTDFQKTTKKFLEVYRLNQTEFSGNQEKVEAVADQFVKKEPQKQTDPRFDWSFFWKQLGERYQPTVEETEQLKALQLIYAPNELEYFQLVSQALDMQKEKIDLSFLRRALSRFYQAEMKTEQPVLPTQGEDQELKKQGFTEIDIQMIEESKKIPPIEYLQAIKAQKGGYETDQELRLLENLVRRSGLSTSVINILINYVLVVNNQASLNSNYLNTIANEWAQAGIKTPEAAIKHVRTKSKPAFTKKSSQSRQSKVNNRLVRREKLPDWVSQPPKEKQLSPERQAELDKRLANYLNKKAGDE